MIIGHLIGLEVFIKEKFYDNNVFFDISFYQGTSIARVLMAIETMGAKQILLGSDTPFGKYNLKKTIERVNHLPIGKKDKRRILGENMKTLLGMQTGK